MTSEDPFRHHPRLRDLITPPEDSYFRTFDPTDLVDDLKARGIEPPFFSPEDREEKRRAFMNGRTDDFWVFAYGSLMWDPGFDFVEVRRAFAPGFARRFILKDIWGARGTVEQPGSMAALDSGSGCHGLAFRISADDVTTETRRIWTRELAGPAYRPEMIGVTIGKGTIMALSFLADHTAEIIEPDLPRDLQVTYLATGTGFLGSSYDYIRNLASQFAVLGIEDTDLTDLLAEVEHRMETLND